jgi:hypothetical protein
MAEHGADEIVHTIRVEVFYLKIRLFLIFTKLFFILKGRVGILKLDKQQSI